MTEALKQALINNGCREHVEEFGNCIGIVDGLVDWQDGKTAPGPDLDVRWQPSKLRYPYSPETLEVVPDEVLH